MVLQDPAAYLNRGSRGEDIVDQADDRPVGLESKIQPKGILEIFPAIDAAQLGLRHRISDPDQAVGADRLLPSREEQPGEDRGLIEPSPPQPQAMQGNRNDNVTVGEKRQICPLGEISQGTGDRGVAAEFQLMNQLPYGRLVPDERPGEIVRRGRRKTGAAKVPAVGRPVELLHAADGAERLAQKADAARTVRAEFRRAADRKPSAARTAYRRKEQVHASRFHLGKEFHCLPSVRS